MQIFISSQDEYDQVVKTRKHMGNELVIQNNKDKNHITVCTDVTVGKNGKVKTDDRYTVTITAKENGMVNAEGKTTIIGHDNANVIAKGNCKVTLHDSASGNAYDHCQITLKGSSRVAADGNCTVHAHDEAAVSASGSSKVYTYQKASARGTDVTALSGKGESTLIGNKNCSITAKDNCIVYASENCTVQAADNCLVVADSFAKIKSQDNCLIMSKGKPEVTIIISSNIDKCVHLNLDNVTDKNIMSALKQMAQSKAVNGRPYIAIQILKENIPPQRKDAVDKRLYSMGLKDQMSAKDYLTSLIEVDSVKNKTSIPERQLADVISNARKTGYVQGVCECVAVVGNEQNMGKKLLSEMKVDKDMAKKYASPETYKTLEKGIFAQTQDQKLEQKQGVKR